MKEKERISPWIQRERREARELWSEIFPEDSSSFLDYYDAWKMPQTHLGTRYAGGRLVSMIHWNPVRVWMQGRVVESAYLVAVATRPPYRHRGYMTGLLREGLEEEAARAVPFVFLMPADKNIYSPFQFRYIYDRTGGEISLTGHDPTGEIPVIRQLKASEYRETAAWMTDRLRLDRDCFLVRDEAYLAELQAECASDGGALEAIYDGDRRIGVFSWWGAEKVEIRELVTGKEWEEGERSRRLLDALRVRFADRTSLHVITTGWLGAPEPIIMGRIVSLPSFLSGFSSENSLTLRLRVTDPLLPSNDGLFLWNLNRTGSELVRGEADGAPEAALDIGDLTAWLMGGESLDGAKSLRATGPGRRKMDEIRVLQGTFINEIV